MRADGLNKSDFAVAGGATSAGTTIAGLSFQNRASSDRKIKKEYEKSKSDLNYPFPFFEYKQSCAVFMDGTKVSRDEIIKYVANKKGGAHYDPKRDGKKLGQKYGILDKSQYGFTIGGSFDDNGKVIAKGKNTIFHSLLSIAQEVSGADDIQRMLNAIDKAILS